MLQKCILLQKIKLKEILFHLGHEKSIAFQQGRRRNAPEKKRRILEQQAIERKRRLRKKEQVVQQKLRHQAMYAANDEVLREGVSRSCRNVYWSLVFLLFVIVAIKASKQFIHGRTMRSEENRLAKQHGVVKLENACFQKRKRMTRFAIAVVHSEGRDLRASYGKCLKPARMLAGLKIGKFHLENSYYLKLTLYLYTSCILTTLT